MIKVYVAGPYSSGDVIQILKNIGRGEKICAQLFSLGFAPFCPWHDKSYVITNFEDDFTVDQFYKYSIAWLKVSDAMFLIPGWESSRGTLEEIKIAEEIGIPVFKTLEDLLEWKNERI